MDSFPWQKTIDNQLDWKIKYIFFVSTRKTLYFQKYTSPTLK